MDRAARGMCFVAALCGCGTEEAPAWSSCEEARAAATFLEVPTVEIADPVEVGDELPVLRWSTGFSGSEELASQALALACILTHDDVSARPALLGWAQTEFDGTEPADDKSLFDRDLAVSLRRNGPRAALSVARDVSSEPALDAVAREGQASELVASLLEEGAVVGGSIDDVVLTYLNTTLVGADGTRETSNRLASVSWRARVGRAHLGLDSVEARVDENGHVSSISVPLARLYDEGERVSAEVAEAEAGALFDQKAQAGLDLDGWTVEGPTGQLSLPVRESREASEMMWIGSYVPVSEDGRTGRRTPYFMSMTDPEAPLIDF